MSVLLSHIMTVGKRVGSTGSTERSCGDGRWLTDHQFDSCSGQKTVLLFVPVTVTT